MASSTTTTKQESIKGPDPTSKNIQDGSNLNIGIVHARWNKPIIDRLLKGTLDQLQEQGVLKKNIHIWNVPGSWELPFTCHRMKTIHPRLHVIIAIGVLIKGETMHFEYISQAVTQGLMSLQVPPADSKSHPEGYHYVPVVFGVLTVLNEDQAWARAGGRPTDDGEPLVQEQGQGQGHDTNHGIEWAKVAVEMGLLKAYGYS